MFHYFIVFSELNKTKIYYIAQSDIAGSIPRSLVESTLPNAVLNFFINIRRQIEQDGQKEFSFWLAATSCHCNIVHAGLAACLRMFILFFL